MTTVKIVYYRLFSSFVLLWWSSCNVWSTTLILKCIVSACIRLSINWDIHTQLGWLIGCWLLKVQWQTPFDGTECVKYCGNDKDIQRNVLSFTLKVPVECKMQTLAEKWVTDIINVLCITSILNISMNSKLWYLCPLLIRKCYKVIR